VSITPSIQSAVCGQFFRSVSFAGDAEPSTGTYQPPLNKYNLLATFAAPCTPSLNESGRVGHVVAIATGGPYVSPCSSAMPYSLPRKKYMSEPMQATASTPPPCDCHCCASGS